MLMESKTILITGAKGMLGQDAVPLFRENGYSVIPVDIKDFEITDKQACKNFLKDKIFHLILHLAAYTAVDAVETEQEKAFAVNKQGTQNMAEIASDRNIPIIYISTDYVFDGRKPSPYLPNDPTNTLNIYGASKLAGEKAVKRITKKHYIIRTSWMYGFHGKNFVETMLSLAQKSSNLPDPLKVVNDQIGCPTWTVDLVKGILKILQNASPYGIYHVCGSGSTTWYGFAKKIFELENIEKEIIPVSSEEFSQKANRPKYSAMENGGILPNWDDSLEKYLQIRRIVMKGKELQ